MVPHLQSVAPSTPKAVNQSTYMLQGLVLAQQVRAGRPPDPLQGLHEAGKPPLAKHLVTAADQNSRSHKS